MPSSRQRKNVSRVTSEDSRNGKAPQALKQYSTPLNDEYRTSHVLSLVTHASLLVFYAAVHVWGALVVMELASSKKFNFTYTHAPVKVLMYATIQNLYIQTGYCALALTSDLMPTSKLKLRLKELCSWLFTTLAFPLSMIVVIGYWTLYMIDDGYLYDEAGSAVMEHIPSLLNHSWHTAVGIAVLLELFVVFHRHPSHRVAMVTIFIYVNMYTAEVFTMYYLADIVPYPFLRQLGPSGMAAFFLLVIPVMMALYYMARTLAHFRWGEKCVS